MDCLEVHVGLPWKMVDEIIMDCLEVHGGLPWTMVDEVIMDCLEVLDGVAGQVQAPQPWVLKILQSRILHR